MQYNAALMKEGEVMSERAKLRSDEMKRRAKEYVAYQRTCEREERTFKRGFDAAFRARRKDDPRRGGGEVPRNG